MKSRAHRVIIVSSLIIILFVAMCPLSYAAGQVSNQSQYFKAVAVRYRDIDIDMPLQSFQVTCDANDWVNFTGWYADQTITTVAVRLELSDVFNNLTTQWYGISPNVNLATSNLISYTFTIVERSYSGNIAFDFTRQQYIYTVQILYDVNTGKISYLNEDYGDRYMGRYAYSTNGYLPDFDSQCDLIIQMYTANTRGNPTFNMNPLIVGCGSGSKPVIYDNGYNASSKPVYPDMTGPNQQLDQNLAEQEVVAVQLSTILDYCSNPATMLNAAMDRTKVVFRWNETKAALQCVEYILNIDPIYYTAWGIALFGSVFSLFNLGISFASTGAARSERNRRDAANERQRSRVASARIKRNASIVERTKGR